MRNPKRQNIWASVKRVGKEQSSDERENAKFL
jgi:hypothetical protein